MLQLNTEHKEICSQSLISIVLIILEILNFCVKVSKELSKCLDAGGNLQLSTDVGSESRPLLGHHLASSVAIITGIYHILSSPPATLSPWWPPPCPHQNPQWHHQLSPWSPWNRERKHRNRLITNFTRHGMSADHWPGTRPAWSAPSAWPGCQWRWTQPPCSLQPWPPHPPSPSTLWTGTWSYSFLACFFYY